MKPIKLIFKSILFAAFFVAAIYPKCFSQNGGMFDSNHSSQKGEIPLNVEAEQKLTDVEKMPYPINLVINRGVSDYNGYALRLNKNGVLMGSSDSSFSGCRWEFVPKGNNRYLIINRGDSDYNGWALRLNKDGSLMASEDTYFSGCIWELVTRDGLSLIINRGNSDYNGWALRIDIDGVLRASKDTYFSGCKWELLPQD